MSAITLHIPDDLAERLPGREDQLAQILELGLREIDITPGGFAGTSDVLELLASLPAPEAILALRPSEQLQQRSASSIRMLYQFQAESRRQRITFS